MLTPAQAGTKYVWPTEDLREAAHWDPQPDGQALWRSMPEADADVARDSRWPAFFPSPICIVTTGDGSRTAVEKVVGASVVNRFPYVVALSFCRDPLSDRHYARSSFCAALERNGSAVVQFLTPGSDLDAVMRAIGDCPDEQTDERLARTGLPFREGRTNRSPTLDAAFMTYEARLVTPTTDHTGSSIYERSFRDVGSHRIYFMEIQAIQLREDIASGTSQINWRSLPVHEGASARGLPTQRAPRSGGRYQKQYTPDYRFPSAGTAAFEADAVEHGMAVKLLDRELVLDNDRARWPCFFPQSAGVITSQDGAGRRNVMPCGSTTIVSRHPLVIAPCISYASINERYAPRASLEMIERTGWFGCGVPFIDDDVLDAIRFTGNTSLAQEPLKLEKSGFAYEDGARAPVLTSLPVFFECEVVDEVSLGTHVMFFGAVRRIRVRSDVTLARPLEWCPWPDVVPVL